MSQANEIEVKNEPLEQQSPILREKKKAMMLEAFFERVSEEAASDLGGDRVNGD